MSFFFSSPSSKTWSSLFLKTFIATFVALCFSIPLVAFRAEFDSMHNLLLFPRFSEALLFVGSVFLISILGQILRPYWAHSSKLIRSLFPRFPLLFSYSQTFLTHRFSRWISFCGLLSLPLLLSFYLGPSTALKWINNYGIQILIYMMLAWGLNIVVGLAGLLDLGYVAFYAVGAYSYALLSTYFGLSFWLCLPLAGGFASFTGFLLGFPVLRLRGDYLAVVTLAFGEIVRLILINWVSLTHGYAGLGALPRITFFGLPFTAGEEGFAYRFGLAYSPLHRTLFLFYLVLFLAFLTYHISFRLRYLPIGRAWEALREDEIACRALGLSTVKIKLAAFSLGAFFAGIAGCFFAVRQGFVSPESFTFDESAMILALVVLGGLGSQTGIALAAILLIGGLEALRELDILHKFFGQHFDPSQYRMLIFSLFMILMMIWRPRGLGTSRLPTLFLRPSSPQKIGAEFIREGQG